MTVKTKIDELLELYNLPIQDLINIANKITRENFENKIEFCSIISAKTGRCGENCKYCSQSVYYDTFISSHPLISIEKVKKAALSAKENGATRFCVVTSGKNPSAKDFDEILKMIETVASIKGLNSCCSLGILEENQILQLKKAGLKRYNHNLNTCKSYYNQICTTHSYEDRINTVKLIQSHGIESCTGGIIGMGETRKQRVELALELAELNPVSVPINFLIPIKGTPLEKYYNAIDEDEILKTLAIFRITLPKALIRYAGGRSSRLSKKYQELGIKAGVNALLVGNYLTTTGISLEEDLELIKNNEMDLVKC
ncbi:MAG: biotin synthase BioB [bacterium]